MTYAIKLRREDALTARAVIVSLAGGFVYQRMKVVKMIDESLGLNEIPMPIALMPERIEIEVAFECLNALWFALLERGAQPNVSGTDFLALELVARKFRLGSRWDTHFEGQQVTECILPIDDEETVDEETADARSAAGALERLRDGLPQST